MRMLIAGGAGFVGSHLARRFLASGHHVVIVDNFLTGRQANIDWLRGLPGAHAVEVVRADVSRFEPPSGSFDGVFHLASPASPKDYLRHPLATMEAGSSGTRNLLELAVGEGARFLLASTSEVYGDPEVHPQPESYWGRVNPVGPRAVYDEAKRYAEALASAYARTIGLTVRIARIFNTYGPGMRLDDGRVIPTFVSQALTGAPLTIFGDGSQTRSYCYVDDLVTALEALFWSDLAGPVNLGNDGEYTVRETAERVIALTGSSSTIEYHPLPDDDPHVRRPDLSRAVQGLGWTPRVRFEDGLRHTVADLAARIHAREPSSNGAPDGTIARRDTRRATSRARRAKRDARSAGGFLSWSSRMQRP